MEVYSDPRAPASFGGPEVFRKHLKGKFSAKQIKDFLIKRDEYTLHKPVRKRFRRRKVFTLGIDDLWQADLADLSSIAKHNDNYKFLLTCIDTFSKFAWAIPLKNKSTTTVAEGFEKILSSSNRRPCNLQTDKGTEFLGTTFQKKLKDYGIKFYTSQNEDIKCAIVERWNRKLKSKMYRYFTFKNTLRYIDVLDDLLHSYNNTFHSTIKMAPSEVTKANEAEIRERTHVPKRKPVYKLTIGDKVRIVKGKREFKKGYLPSWTEEIFTVIARYPTDPPVYEIEDYDSEKVHGKFYDFELQKVVKADDIYKVEKVLKKRKTKGKTEYFVKWIGYPEKFNSWVSDIKPT